MEMDFHTCLGVKGNSTEEEIICAYNNKVSIVESVANVDTDVRERRITELTEAKEKCLAWREATFVEKGKQIVRSTEKVLLSKSNHNACCGPFTLCCYGPTENTGMTWCCKDCDSECAICVDVSFWLTVGPLIFMGFRDRAKENRRKEEAAVQEQNRIAKLKEQSEERFKSRYTGFEPSRDSIRRAINDIEQNTYTNMFQEGEGKVPRDYAINTIREHTNSILGYYSECILNRSFDDAEECLRLLRHILASTANAEKQLRNMRGFYQYSPVSSVNSESVWNGDVNAVSIPNMGALLRLLAQGEEFNPAACIFALKELRKYASKEDIRKIVAEVYEDLCKTDTLKAEIFDAAVRITGL